MNLKKMFEVYRAFKNGTPIGDVVVMKFAALRQPPAEINARLGDVAGYAPELAFDALDEHPQGSLGAASGQSTLAFCVAISCST